MENLFLFYYYNNFSNITKIQGKYRHIFLLMIDETKILCKSWFKVYTVKNSMQKYNENYWLQDTNEIHCNSYS